MHGDVLGVAAIRNCRAYCDNKYLERFEGFATSKNRRTFNQESSKNLLGAYWRKYAKSQEESSYTLKKSGEPLGEIGGRDGYVNTCGRRLRYDCCWQPKVIKYWLKGLSRIKAFHRRTMDI